jgi:hypothetical protein
MPTNFPMPGQDRVRDVLADLMGRTVTVARTEAAPLEVDGPGPAALADYEADGGSIGVLCVADVRLANALGAALTMIAPAAVDEAVENLRIDDPTIDNFREVVNVLTSLFNTTSTPHVKFREVHRLPSQLPAETVQLLEAPRGRRDFDVSVEDYGTGRLSLFIA